MYVSIKWRSLKLKSKLFSGVAREFCARGQAINLAPPPHTLGGAV